MTRFIIIAAHDPALVIGKDGKLPWHLPEDLKHFKTATMGHPILMGRGVFEEIGEKPLPGRENLVLTSRDYPNVPTFRSIPDAISHCKEQGYAKVFIIGGGKIYKQMMEMADEMMITEVHETFDGDTFFPEYRHLIGKQWMEVEREKSAKCDFVRYGRMREG